MDMIDSAVGEDALVEQTGRENERSCRNLVGGSVSC
jgi:hypothetical protein